VEPAKGSPVDLYRPASHRPVPHAAIRSALRRLWLFSWQRREAIKRSRLSHGLYLCGACGRAAKKISVDHIDRVGHTPGARNAHSASWDDLIKRMFCDANGLQILCKPCHDKKTKEGK
jgi:hypothetical protein